MDHACAVRMDVIAQPEQILAAAFAEAFQRSLNDRQDLHVLCRWFYRRIDERFRFQVQSPRLLQEAERKTSNDAEGILTVNAALREGEGDGLLDAVLLREIGKINGLLEDRGSGYLFLFHGFDEQGERRQRDLLVFEFNLGADRLTRDTMCRQ